MTPITMTTMTTRIQWTLSGLVLMGLVACSGGGGTNPPPPPPKAIADRMDYTNPTSGTYTLVKDASSTSSHLVLNLLGPAGTSTTGVGFYLSADTTKVTWVKPASSDAILAHNVIFDLGTAPQLAVAKAKVDSQNNQTGQLQVAYYQKGTSKPAVTLGATSILASVALDLKANVPVGTAVTLSAVTGKAVLSNGSAAPTPITISGGSLVAN